MLKKQIITIHLPALIHRIGSDNVKLARMIAQDEKARLKRIRRSRNWELIGDIDAVTKTNEKLLAQKSEKFRHLTEKITQALASYEETFEPLEEKLKRLIREKPTITLSELMEKTNCTLAKARTARSEGEEW